MGLFFSVQTAQPSFWGMEHHPDQARPAQHLTKGAPPHSLVSTNPRVLAGTRAVPPRESLLVGHEGEGRTPRLHQLPGSSVDAAPLRSLLSGGLLAGGAPSSSVRPSSVASGCFGRRSSATCLSTFAACFRRTSTSPRMPFSHLLNWASVYVVTTHL